MPFDIENVLAFLLSTSIAYLCCSLGGELGFSLSLCAIESSSGDRIEFKVLLKGATSLGRVGEALLFMVDAQVIEGRNENDGEGERNTRDTDLGSVPSASEGGGQDEGTVGVICTVVRIGPRLDTVRTVGREATFLIEMSLCLLTLRRLQKVHFYEL